MKNYTIVISNDTHIELPKADIRYMKCLLQKEGTVGYDKIVPRVSLRTCKLRLKLIPGSKLLLTALNICMYLPWLFHLTSLFLIITFSWKSCWWTIVVSIGLDIILLTFIQTQINWELGARLLVLDSKLRNILEDPETAQEVSKMLFHNAGITREDFIAYMEE